MAEIRVNAGMGGNVCVDVWMYGCMYVCMDVWIKRYVCMYVYAVTERLGWMRKG